MLFTVSTLQAILLLSGSLSTTILPALAVPSGGRRHHEAVAAAIMARAPKNSGAGWPFSSSESRSSFGITDSFRTDFLSTVEGAPTLVASYPKGSYAGSNKPGQPKGPGIAGFIFSAAGEPGLRVDQAQEATLTYEVKFPAGFQFARGGKMPGLYGGDDAATASRCSGGRHSDSCWSARIMWRDGGKGELYAYLPTANQKLAVCKGKCDVKYGASMGTGKWVFPTGTWTKVTERVRLNTIGKNDGEIEVSINGASAFKVDGLQLRSSDRGRIRGTMMHTFFGGSSSPDFASPKDQKAFFRGFNIEVTQKFGEKAPETPAPEADPETPEPALEGKIGKKVKARALRLTKAH
ncbi:hypothetical protein DXG03_008310 [Asterophora parasitica]|uniref:Polysaccharide lyase 14 domain-containing protein n=1 Tax=Asterophora parasitica TaxID=117018 RepID=A0A9P7G6J9_9AGAR|nr:hypothetical protein DXG03_008310 [Asterophora parasitica]